MALIAQGRLSVSAKEKIKDIWGPKPDDEDMSLEDIANCADELRVKKYNTGQIGDVNCAGVKMARVPETAPWHFIDIPISDSPNTLAPYCANGNCVVDAIKNQLKILKGSKEKAQQQKALMFVVHFVGDLHQPLHCATKLFENGASDRGGNDRPIRFFKPWPKPLNLHKLWDDLLDPVAVREMNPAALTAKLQKIPDETAAGWLSDTMLTDAAMESWNFAKDEIYPAYANNSSIDQAYQEKMQPTVDERLQKAGVRLAALLEKALE